MGSRTWLPKGNPHSAKSESLADIDRELQKLLTEQRNPATTEIDRKSVMEILELINTEDKMVPYAVEKEIPHIARAVDLVVSSFKAGGRLFYVGAGTSGRLGVVDAAEFPPTFSVHPSLVQAIVAGGRKAVWRSVEGAEDDYEGGRKAIVNKGTRSKDTVIGLSASGSTLFVVGALEEAKRTGAKTIAVSTNPESTIARIADVAVTPIVGPEAIAGSTRMKAGTAEKLVLNMISTASMIRMGKVYSNLMIDLKPASRKLRSRARRILKILTGIDSKTAHEAFEESGRNLKVALVMIEANTSRESAVRALRERSGIVGKAIEDLLSLDRSGLGAKTVPAHTRKE